MMLRRIRYKLLLVVGVAAALGLVGTSIYYTQTAEEVIVSQHSRTLHKMTEAVAMSVESMMLEGHAELAREYAGRLRNIAEMKDFRILRVDGTEAFRDNKTIDSVNARLGREEFQRRRQEEEVPIVAPGEPRFAEAIGGREAVMYYGVDQSGQRLVHFLDPIFNQELCRRCHAESGPVRGVIKVSTSMAPVELDIMRVREESTLVLVAALVVTMLLTGYMLGRTVVQPIEDVTAAMARVSGGDLDHRVPAGGRDELGRMARNFNEMTSELQCTYDGLRREQDKLTTIIQGAREAIVVTDSTGVVVLVNPAAEQLLGKTREDISRDGFMGLLDDPQLMRDLIDGKCEKSTVTAVYNKHVFLVSASSIFDAAGQPIGSAALLRDVTEETRLQEELRRLSTTDGLTGLYNRRHLDATLRAELNRASHTGTPLSVIMFDVDHFKRFNDEHGHDQGDRVLQTVAKAMRQALRKYDVACRYGGEEFLAILPGTVAAGAFSVAERLRADVEGSAVDGLHVTISLGVATYPDIPVLGSDALVEAADAAMYRAKQSGRNAVSVAPAPATAAVVG